MSDIDRDLSDHVPFWDAESKPRCEACGYLFPCPDVRLTPRSLDAAERMLLDVLEVGVGFRVWKRLPDGSELDPAGGVVVGVWEDDDGIHVRTVDVAANGNRSFARFRLGEVEPTTIELPNAATIRQQARRLAAAVAKTKGLATAEDVELLGDALTLIRSVA